MIRHAIGAFVSWARDAIQAQDERDRYHLALIRAEDALRASLNALGPNVFHKDWMTIKRALDVVQGALR